MEKLLRCWNLDLDFNYCFCLSSHMQADEVTDVQADVVADVCYKLLDVWF